MGGFGGGGTGGGDSGGLGGGTGGGGGTSSVDAGPPSSSRVDNPYEGAVPYVNPDWAALVVKEANGQTGSLAKAMLRVSRQPTFIWLDRIAAIAGTATVKGVRHHLDAALAQQTASQQQVVVQFVVYDLPNRDCNALASNGELLISQNGFARYKTEFIDPLVTILKSPTYSTLRVVTLIEVDSLPNLVTNPNVPKCQEAAGPGGYIDGVTYALNQLATVPNVYNYIDIGHSGWLGWDDNRNKAITQLAAVIDGTTQKWNSVAGFASNSANYTPVEEPNLPDPNASLSGNPLRSASFYEWNPNFDELDYVTSMRTALIAKGAPQRLGMLIDTGRNGWGGAARPSAATGSTVNDFANSGRIDRRLHRGNWCNQSGAGIGALPVAAPHPGVHAFVWVKPPGESDGIATPTSGPNADGKQHDPMCDPTFVGSQQSNGGHLTGALAGAPHAGEWFSAHFVMLVQNAFPGL